MEGDTDKSVVIAGDRCRIVLTPTGKFGEYGIATKIDIIAGPFEGSYTDGFVGNYRQFRKELFLLRETLSGRATLGSLERNLTLVFTGNGRGAIFIAGEVISDHVPCIALKFEFEIDQSYLPKIIESIERNFVSLDPNN